MTCPLCKGTHPQDEMLYDKNEKALKKRLEDIKVKHPHAMWLLHNENEEGIYSADVHYGVDEFGK